MDDPRNWAVSYLALRGNVPWRWADGGEVVVWSDGTTIAFREEIAFVLEWLVPHGWPPFGSLIWLLAATRGKLPPSTARHSSISVHEVAGDQAGYLARLAEMHVAVVSGLGMVARLPAELRTTQRAKAILAEAVFGESPDEGRPDRKELLSAVVKVLRSGELNDAMLNDPGAALQVSSQEWLALHDGLNQLSFEALKLRIRTGLEALPRAAEIPEIASARVRALLEDLRNDPAGAGLSRLARDFMAAVQLPRRLSEHDELPIGGFADLANRGNLDRLLLSELAHDDLTLAVRIALNEALYLRREPPVKQPPSTLAILLDSGVRMWGVPRVMATAVAMALVAKSARHEIPVVFRAHGGVLAPVDVLSREGLVSHLEALETDAQPGAALAAFHALVAREPNAEAVLITHRDALADPDFCRSLVGIQFAMLYLATVDREGNFELRRHPQGGPAVCQARMRVDDLLSDPQRAMPGVSRPLIDREKHPDLPVILSLAPFPLLLSVRGKVVASVAVHRPDGLAKVGGTSGGLCVMQDRRLMRWSYPACGAETLAWGLPRGRTLWLGELDDGRVVVLKVHEASQHVVCQIYRADGEPLWTHHWRFREPVRRAELHGDVVFVITLSEAHAYDLAGRVLGKLEVGRANSHGRYFPSHDHIWRVLVWDGLAVRLDPVTLPAPVPQSSILRLFHRQGCEGPWCLTKEGDVYSHTGSCVLKLGALRSVARVSENGHRLLVAEAAGGVTRLVDLLSMRHRVITGPVRDQDWVWSPVPPSAAVRVRFNQIGIDDWGALWLHSRSTGWHQIELSKDHQTLQMRKRDGGPRGAVNFVPVPGWSGRGFGLRQAVWSDGRCAWLDDRGMLHLRSANRDVPEVTLVLADSMSGWTSDQQWFGNAFFTGPHPCGKAAELARCLGQFGQPVPHFVSSPA